MNKIKKVTYGIKDKNINVTEKVANLIKDNNLIINQNYNKLFGDPIYGKVKELIIEYTDKSGKNITRKYKENDKVIINNISKMISLQKAIYGTKDKNINVTEKVTNLIKDNNLIINQNYNKLFGDPIYGKVKELIIEYTDKSGKNITRKYKENDKVIINNKSKIKNDLDKELDQIYIQNEEIIKEIKNNYDTNDIYIIAKGSSAIYVKDIKNKVTIGINQGLIFTNGEFLCINDFESIFGIEHLIPKIKYIFMPYHIHVFHKSSNKFNYKNVLEYLNQYSFTGKVFVFFIQTDLNKNKTNKSKYYFTVGCSTKSAICITEKFLKDKISSLNIYGYKCPKGYHKDINLLISNTYFNNKYNINPKYIEYFNNSKNNYSSPNNHYNYNNKNL